MKFNHSDHFESLLKTRLENTNKSFSNDMLIGRYLFLISDHDKSEKFQNIIESHLEGKSNYKFESLFSEQEKNLLKKISPNLVYSFSFPVKYKPTSGVYFPEDEKEGIELEK